ncbi:MAG: HEAT repeat domain-containing protein [Methanocrinis sp.]
MQDHQAAAYTLGKIGDTKVVDPLINALNDDDWRGRSTTAHALGRTGDAKAVNPLIVALRDETKGVLMEGRRSS